MKSYIIDRIYLVIAEKPLNKLTIRALVILFIYLFVVQKIYVKYTLQMKNLILSLAFVFTFNLFAEIGVSDNFIKRFSSLPSYTNVDISPDGKMISVLTKMSDNKKGLSILRS